MRRKPRPPAPDLRAPWQIEQAARCGCRGTDDLCPCQNVTPWPQPVIDWQARAEAAEARATQAEKERDAILAHVKGLEIAFTEADDAGISAEASLSRLKADVVGVLEPFAQFDPEGRAYRRLVEDSFRVEDFRAAAALLTLLREGGMEGVVQTNVAPQCGVGPSDLTGQGGEP